MTDHYPSLNEDLSAEPVSAAIQAVLRQQIEAGADPKDVVHSAFVVAGALGVDVSGLAATGLFLIDVGRRLGACSPEVQTLAATREAAESSERH